VTLRAKLRQLRRIRRSLDDDSVTTLVHAFVASRVDYCGSLLIGAPRKTTDKLQRVLNSAARTRASSTGDSLISGEVSYTGWMLSTGFGSEFASRCSDICTRWLLNTCLPIANPSPASLAVATCDRLTVQSSRFPTCETCFVWRTFICIRRPFELELTSCLP